MIGTLNSADILLIVALLPLTATMTVLQKNPYHALVVRGILGAISALVYALLGAADVALTEALVGTMLSIMLYAVAVRSSLVLKLGVLATPELASPKLTDLADATLIESSPEILLKPDPSEAPNLSTAKPYSLSEPLHRELQTLCQRHYLRLELVPYADLSSLQEAIADSEVHAILVPSREAVSNSEQIEPVTSLPTLQVRVEQLREFMEAEIQAAQIALPLATRSERQEAQASVIA